MRVYGSYVLVELDPQKVSAIAHRLLEIYRVILARAGLGSNVKLNLIELEDRIGDMSFALVRIWLRREVWTL